MKIIKLFISTLIMVLVFSCYDSNEDDLTVQDLDIVATTYDQEFNFDLAQTFVLPDSIIRITGSGNPVTSNPAVPDEIIIERVRQNMLDLGYTEEPDPENNPVDLAVVIQTLQVDTYVVTDPYFFWDYWGWYPWNPGYGYGPGYGWYYPYPVVVGSYSTGTLLINMFDPEQADAGEELIPIAWLGALNGLLQGSDSNLQSRVIRGIDQAFEQSPYLAN